MQVDVDSPLPGGRVLADDQQIYDPYSKTRLELENDCMRLYGEVQMLQDVLSHLPDFDSVTIEPASAEELDRLQDYQDRSAVRVDPNVDAPQCAGAYKAIDDVVVILANEWTNPFRVDPASGDRIATTALQDGTANTAISWLQTIPDIAQLARYDTVGALVIRGIISRWLYLEIFSKGLAGIHPDLEGRFDAEFLVRPEIIPERAALERRRWYQLLYAGLVAHPTFPAACQQRAHNLAQELDNIFMFLHPGVSYANRLRKDVVEPALRLQQRMALTVQEFKYFFYLVPENPTPPFLSQFGHLASQTLTGRDIADPKKKIEFADQSQAEIARTILPICSITPYISYRNLDPVPMETTLSLRGKMVCARGEPEARVQTLAGIQPGIFHKLLASRT
ncbi:hypothetical protein F5B19DRAFT_459783 [Rostrohypoxylon terebratum]|nr:hypothetical protein F5B19DRAFT_459783 [Rostrohypoxylon terebratum]